MKKMIALFLGLCLLLSGCGTEKPIETEPEPQIQETEPPEEVLPTEPEKEAYMPGNTDFDWKNDYYQYGNFQINLPPGDYVFYDGEVIFCFDPNHPLYSFDLTTGEVRLFCAKDDCDHSGNECVYIKESFNVVDQYGGNLYSRRSGHVAKLLPNGKWEEVVKKNVWRFWHWEDDLYITDREHVLQVYRGGTGEPETLMEDYDYAWNTIFDGYLYSGTPEELVRVDLNAETLSKEVLLTDVCYRVDGDHIYYTDDETHLLYRCKMDGTNSVLLYDQPVLPASMNFDDEYFYFRLYNDKKYLDYGEGSHDIFRLNKSKPSQIEKIATLEEAVYQIFTVPKTGKLFVTTYIWGKQSGEPIYVMNTDGSNVMKLENPYNNH